jgi:hypothetical protein
MITFDSEQLKIDMVFDIFQVGQCDMIDLLGLYTVEKPKQYQSVRAIFVLVDAAASFMITHGGPHPSTASALQRAMRCQSQGL